MFDLQAELDSVRQAFDAEGIEYALCGGLAMAVHGFPRATIDIDVLIQPGDLERAYAVAERLGYIFRARPMSFDKGRMEIRRVTKIDPKDGEALMLDMLLVTDASKHVWETRREMVWRGTKLWVVSPDGLISLKSGRASHIDLADIEHLRGKDEH